MKILKWGGWTLVALACGAGVAWWKLAPMTVQVGVVTQGPAIEAVYATGMVEPTVMVPVSPRSGGRLLTLDVDEGAAVRKGQVLARLDADDLQHTVEEMQARAKLAQTQLDRTRTLVQQQFLSPAELDRTRTELDAARAALERARALSSYSVLTAPADGVVLKRDGEKGQFIAAGQTVFTLSCCAPLRVAAEVDEEDISRVQIGQSVSLRTDALPQQLFDGEVAEITPKGDPVARSYRVRIRFKEASTAVMQALRTGMTMDANILIARREQALLVPAQAVQAPATHEPLLWSVGPEGQLHRHSVRLGVKTTERIEILSGGISSDIHAGTQVVLQPTEVLQEGLHVRVVRAVHAAQALK
ncbi:efflux RND transporter periplasmic adaptor subunit [Leptothrix ochracea]|uniref:efflux RND transporter periplasmic adaptor subunit n=1 Tax=Leptothrix ochracea TaxID=735331 RepID=UPI0034E22EB4